MIIYKELLARIVDRLGDDLIVTDREETLVGEAVLETINELGLRVSNTGVVCDAARGYAYQRSEDIDHQAPVAVPRRGRGKR